MKRKVLVSLFMILTCFPVLTVSAGIFDWPNLPSGNTSEISLNITSLPYSFSTEDLEQRLNVPAGSLKGITITQLPETSQGKLQLNGEPVNLYEEIGRNDIENLTFTSAKVSSSVSLSILPEVKDAVQTVVALRVQTSSMPIEVASGEYETLSEVPVYGYLSAYHPNGDFLRTILVEKPQKGTVSFDGQTFCYEPFPQSEGVDRFAVALVDDQGNRSAETVQTISIEQKNPQYDYWDLNGSPAYYSAVKLLEDGIFSGETIGSRRYFGPKQSLTRVEFLMLLISACGWEAEIPAASPNTGLLNDSEIPAYLKPYVTLGIQKGIIVEKTFRANEIPTRAESVVLTDRACGLSTVERINLPWSDLNEIPQWALQSYMNLSGYGFLSFPNNCAHPNDGLTRENTADLLWQCRKYNTSRSIK